MKRIPKMFKWIIMVLCVIGFIRAVNSPNTAEISLIQILQNIKEFEWDVSELQEAYEFFNTTEFSAGIAQWDDKLGLLDNLSNKINSFLDMVSLFAEKGILAFWNILREIIRTVYKIINIAGKIMGFIPQ